MRVLVKPAAKLKCLLPQLLLASIDQGDNRLQVGLSAIGFRVARDRLVKNKEIMVITELLS